ncbi:MAG: anti-sigma factor [Chloroflexota bacterium]|nr:MAG: anti-sigma factor [Chloroflexota bacterium]
MSTLHHADAHERIADLSLEPDGLLTLARELADVDAGANSSPAHRELLAHVVGCAECRADVVAWSRTHGMVREALIDATGSGLVADLADAPRVAAPAGLRDAVLAQIRQDPEPGADRSIRSLRPDWSMIRRIRLRSVLPIAAVLAVIVVAGGALLDGSARLGRAESEAVALEAMSVTVDRVLQDPDHRVIELRDLDGISRGSVSWSSRDLVVLTTALAPPPEGRVYRCWIERDGQRSGVGRMVFAGGTSFWVGTLGAWGSTSFGAGSVFGISLEPVSGSEGNPAILEAALGG